MPNYFQRPTINPEDLMVQGRPNVAPSPLQGLMGNRDLAMALLANSGYSPQKRSFGEIIGTSAIQADQMKQAREDDAFKRQYMQAQMAAMTGKNQQPNAVKEYEFAKGQGYKGTYEEWIKMNGQTSRPSSVQEWEAFNALSPQDQSRYLEMKRSVPFSVNTIGGAETGVARIPGTGEIRQTPLSTPQQEIAFAAQKKAAEGQAGAIGAGQGAITAEIQKKGSNAKTVLGMVDEAERLIDSSTGSAVGAGVDILAGGVGRSTEGAKSIARLRVLQAGLMMNMPRMEGPQGEKDVELYQQAAAQIGDPTVPRETRKAALQTIRFLQTQYAERASQPFQLFPNGTQTPDGWTVLPGGIKVREKK